MSDEFYPLVFSHKEKEEVQKLCYRKWEENNYKGIFTLSTGVGKSFLIYMALIKYHHLGRCFVIVPKVDLMHQIYDDIVNLCKIESVGRIGGGYSEIGKEVTIAVINSIRDKVFASEFIAVDEIHNAISQENIKFLKKGFHKKIMGLTATIDETKLMNSGLKLPILHSMEQKEAVDKGILSPYKIINIGCNLSYDEQQRYDYHDKIVKNDMRDFDYDIGKVIECMKFSNDYDMKQKAVSVFRGIQGRKSIVSNSIGKLNRVVSDIIDKQHNKIILFCEYIKTADYIIKELKKLKIKAAKFHSKMSYKEKQDMFEKFKNNEMRVMISVKALNEGTNIPDCDIAMIVSGNSVKKDIVQRIGRVVRVSEGKDFATIYQYYCIGTKDEDWTRERIKYVNNAASEVLWL